MKKFKKKYRFGSRKIFRAYLVLVSLIRKSIIKYESLEKIYLVKAHYYEVEIFSI